MPLTVELDRSSPVPLYYQLAQAIEAAIRDGELSPGDRFENELALAKRLTLSRPTTRRAIQELVDKGLLVRKRGVGTQVVQNPVHRRVELTSLFDDLARAGQEPTTQLLDYRVGPPDEEVARELSLKDDREVVSIHRLRCANGEPLAVMTNHLPVEIAPDRRGTRDQRALPVAASPRRAHPAGPPTHRRPRRDAFGGQAARREARRTAADDVADGLRRLRYVPSSSARTATARRATTSTPPSSTADQ